VSKIKEDFREITDARLESMLGACNRSPWPIENFHLQVQYHAEHTKKNRRDLENHGGSLIVGQ